MFIQSMPTPAQKDLSDIPCTDSIQDARPPSINDSLLDDPIDSESSDSDDGSFEMPPEAPRPKEWHNDHWDEVVQYENPYAECEWPGESWFDTNIYYDEWSWSNEALTADPITQHYLELLSRLELQTLPSLKITMLEGTFPSYLGGTTRPVPFIPLFKDNDTGAEYQLRLDLGSSLAEVWCPAVNPRVNLPEQNHRLIMVRYRLPQREPHTEPKAVSSSISTPTDVENGGRASKQSPILLPRFLRPLGTLAIRSFGRYNDFYTGPELTEKTDYEVMLDVESESLSVWLLSSRRRLRDRAHEEQGCVTPIYPIFKGQMLEGSEVENGDGYGYDVACIMDSVRQVGTCTYEEACELVGRTRAIADPAEVLGVSLNSKWREIVGMEEDSA